MRMRLPVRCPFTRRVACAGMALPAMLCVLAVTVSMPATAQTGGPSQRDTLRPTLADASRLFLDRNLSLLAARANIDVARAQAVQAGLWDNPSLTLGGPAYNPLSGRPLDFWSSGAQRSVQIDQLFQLAGKRNKQVRVYELGASIAEDQFYDLMRTLRYTLVTAFYDLHYLLQSKAVYDRGIGTLERTIASYETLRGKGDVPEQDVLRLKALQLGLEAERQEIMAGVAEKSATLLVLLRDTLAVSVSPRVAGNPAAGLSLAGISVDTLLDIAHASRRDLRAARTGVAYQEATVRLQKALAWPDLTVGGVYDHVGSAWTDYFGVELQVILPVFNRNQGGIAAAEAGLGQAQALAAQAGVQVSRDVAQAWSMCVESDALASRADSAFAGSFDDFIARYVGLYERRVIGLLEFTDMFESYKNSMIQIQQLGARRMDAYSALDFAIGTRRFITE
jgi:outer membrane protein, heavy metal efflux system